MLKNLKNIEKVEKNNEKSENNGIILAKKGSVKINKSSIS